MLVAYGSCTVPTAVCNQVETITTTAREQVDISMTRVHDLRHRIEQLKLRFTENELKVQQAAEAVRAAEELASRAEQVNHHSPGRLLHWVCDAA